MASYWVKLSRYPSKVKSNDDIQVTIDWEAGYGEWLVTNAEAYFKFYIDEELVLTSSVFKRDGPETFELTTPSGLTDGDELVLKVEMWDKDILFDDNIGVDEAFLTVDAAVDDGGGDIITGGTFTWVESLAKYFKWVIVGAIIAAILISVWKTGAVNLVSIVTYIIIGAIAYAIYAFWRSSFAIWAALGLVLIMVALAWMAPEATTFGTENAYEFATGSTLLGGGMY